MAIIAFKDVAGGYYQYDWDGVSDLPAWTNGLTSTAVVPPSVPTLEELKAAFIKRVDAEADAVIQATVGSREGEYRDAEKDALAFAAAGYTGTVPPRIACVATAYGITGQAATDIITAKATEWRTAGLALRQMRIEKKSEAAAANDSTLPVIEAAWDGFVATLKIQLGIA